MTKREGVMPEPRPQEETRNELADAELCIKRALSLEDMDSIYSIFIRQGYLFVIFDIGYSEMTMKIKNKILSALYDSKLNVPVSFHYHGIALRGRG